MHRCCSWGGSFLMAWASSLVTPSTEWLATSTIRRNVQCVSDGDKLIQLHGFQAPLDHADAGGTQFHKGRQILLRQLLRLSCLFDPQSNRFHVHRSTLFRTNNRSVIIISAFYLPYRIYKAIIRSLGRILQQIIPWTPGRSRG